MSGFRFGATPRNSTVSAKVWAYGRALSWKRLSARPAAIAKLDAKQSMIDMRTLSLARVDELLKGLTFARFQACAGRKVHEKRSQQGFVDHPSNGFAEEDVGAAVLQNTLD
jgi:hypothetical protein